MNQVSIIVSGSMLSESILHPFSQPSDRLVGSPDRLRILMALARSFFCLDLTVARSQDTAMGFVSICPPPPPEREGLVGHQFRCPFCDRMGSGNGKRLCRLYWGGHGKAGKTGRSTAPQVDGGGARSTANKDSGYKGIFATPGVAHVKVILLYSVQNNIFYDISSISVNSISKLPPIPLQHPPTYSPTYHPTYHPTYPQSP